MIALPLPTKISQKKKNHAVFEVEGLYPGYGVTVGNALRRVLLSSLQGVAVTEMKMKGMPHEFSTVPGVLEDGIMIMLNVKQLRFKIHEGESHTITLTKKGEGPVTGEDFKLPPQVMLANPELHLMTVSDKKTEVELEIKIEKGIGYVPKEQLRTKKSEIGTIVLDGIFTPIKNVNFQVENMRVGDRTDFDRLSLEVETDGTITPEEAFFAACDILLKHFNILFQGNPEGAAPKTQEKEEDGAGDAGKTVVEDMDLGARTITALTEGGIKTAAGIARRSEAELSELDGMGEKAVAEVKKAMKKLGLELKESEDAKTK